MRGISARVAFALVLGVTVASTAACFGNADAQAACKSMESELTAIPQKAQGMMSKPGEMAQVYSDAASNIRSQGTKAGGDVKTAADQVATDLDSLANTLKQAASGNPQAPDTSSLVSSGAKLQTACNKA